MEQAHCAVLPLDLWEEIVLWLPPGEALSMRLLSRELRELVDNSPAIKYHLDLLSAGLEESADGDPLPLRDRRQKLEAYCSRWESFDRAEYTLLDPPPLPNSQSAYVDKGFLVYYEDVDDGKENIYFVRLPSRTMETSQEEWMIRGLPASGHQQAIHPPSNLLAIPILSEEENSFQIEMFRMSDGKPWSDNVPSPAMGKRYGVAQLRIFRVYLQLTSSRLAARVLRVEADRVSTDLFVWDWRTGKMYLVHAQARDIAASFIDECRLIGTVRRGRKTMLMLWDSSNDGNLQKPPGLIFDSGPDYLAEVVGRTLRNYGTSHGLPFHESPHSGIAAFTTYALKTSVTQVLVIPIRTLVSFAHRIGTVEYVPWQDWLHFAVPIELTQALVSPSTCGILHSQVLCVHRADNSSEPTSILRVYDFSPHSRRRKVKDDPSVPLPPYTVQEFPFDVEYYGSVFGFTEGGVLVTSDLEDETPNRCFWKL